MREKLEILERALKNASSPSEEFSALQNLSEYHLEHDMVDGWNCAKRMLRIAEAGQNRLDVAKSHELIAHNLRKLTEYPEAIDHYELALDSFLGVGEVYGAARCFSGLGIVCGSMEEYQTSLEYFEEALSASRRAKRDAYSATIVGNMGHCYFNLGRYANAIECFEYTISYYRKVDNATATANMLGGLAGVYVFTGEFEKGLKLVEESIELYRKVNDDQGLSIAMMNRGLANFKMGNASYAKDLLVQSLQFSRSIKFTVSELDCLKYLGEVCTALGEEDEAQKYLKLYLDSEQEERKQEASLRAERIQKRQTLRQSQRL